MLRLEDVYDFVYENCENVSTSKHGIHFHTKCPICMDSAKSNHKKRFHIEYTDDNCKYHCFNCNRSGDFYKFYSILKGIDKSAAWKKYHDFNDIKDIWKHHAPVVEQQIKTTSGNCNWILNDCLSTKPVGYIQSQYFKLLNEFVDHRKINVEVFIAYKGRYKNRIIIPVYDGTDIIYFQGRAVDGSEPKYLNPSVEKQSIIFNKDNFKAGPIFITEGILDAQSIGHNGTCCLGRDITDDFLSKLYNYSNELYIVLDNDKSGMESLKQIIKKSQFKNKLRYFLMPKHFKDTIDINILVMHSEVDVERFIVENSHSIGKAAIKIGLEKWRDEAN